MARPPRGFTLLEVLIALVILEIGVLALLATAGSATRLLGRARRATIAATFTSERLERLRTTACVSQSPGSEVRGLDSLAWRFVDMRTGHWRIVLGVASRTERNTWHTDSVETEVSCHF